MEEPFQPLQPERSVSVRIAEQIAARIQAGEFPVGTKLPPETELARQFGVSRPSIREALGALQFVGYVASVRGSGSRIVSLEQSGNQAGAVPAELASQEILRLFEARLLVEPQVAALAAMDPNWEKLEQVEGLIEGMRLLVNKSTLHGETDLRVHRALAKVCRNSYMTAATLKILNVAASPRLQMIRNQAWSNRDLPSTWGDQHRSVVQAIRARDAVTATEASWHHLVSSAQNALTVIIQDPKLDGELVERFERLLNRRPSKENVRTVSSKYKSNMNAKK